MKICYFTLLWLYLNVLNCNSFTKMTFKRRTNKQNVIYLWVEYFLSNEKKWAWSHQARFIDLSYVFVIEASLKRLCRDFLSRWHSEKEKLRKTVKRSVVAGGMAINVWSIDIFVNATVLHGIEVVDTWTDTCVKFPDNCLIQRVHL